MGAREPVWVEREGSACDKHRRARGLRGHHFHKPCMWAVCQAGLHRGTPTPTPQGLRQGRRAHLGLNEQRGDITRAVPRDTSTALGPSLHVS